MHSRSLDYRERLNRVLRHIETNMDNPPGLEELARIACFSPCHFHRIFTAIQGESVAAHIRRLSLQRAAGRLLYTRRSVIDIAFAAGYDSVDAFTRAFRILFGVSPSIYRRTGGPLVHVRSLEESLPSFYLSALRMSYMNVQIKKFPRIPVLAMRYTGVYMECGTAWKEFMTILASHNLSANKVSYSICHDDPDVTPVEKCRMELCMDLSEDIRPDAPEIRNLTKSSEVYVRTIGGDGDFVVMSVKGPYELLHPAYRFLYGEWLPKSGREPDGDPGFELYHNCPSDTPPEDLLTDIFIPLRSK